MSLISLKSFVARAEGVPFLEFGHDFTGWNCWGLIVQAYHECFGIELPGFENISALNLKEVGQLYEAHRRAWKPLQSHQERPGDVVLLRHGPLICHAGLVIKVGLMLHVEQDCATCIEPYNSGTWKARIAGFYRHEQLASHN